jgi:hypothetical protein
MRSKPANSNETAWEALFDKYNILDAIDASGSFQISAKRIKEFREPRLMAKFDHTFNLPKLFKEHKLAILPVTRGDYVISHFAAYHNFETDVAQIEKVSLPSYIQSLDTDNVSTEAIALNCAMATGMIADFLEDEDLVSTVSGRMGSGAFYYDIDNSLTSMPFRMNVNNSQIEIDAAYEGVRGLALFEAKSGLSEDFIIRQLYYPFCVWQSRVTKTVRPIFLVYTNGIYRLYEYKFDDPTYYNSLTLVKHKRYSVENTAISTEDIEQILTTIQIVQEPEKIPFPQADSFRRVVSLCEKLSDGLTMSNAEITDEYAFAERQTGYYTNAALYLGLLQKEQDGRTPLYHLSDAGRRLFIMNYKQRQLELCRRILSHRAFHDTLQLYFQRGSIPDKNEIIQIMQIANIQHISGDTVNRRSSSIRGWIEWIISLINA